MNDYERGSPSRIACRRCGMEIARPCRLDGINWDYCAERIADLRKLYKVGK